jgi:hypothetical protein
MATKEPHGVPGTYAARTMGLIPGLCSSRDFAVMYPMPLHVLFLMIQGGGTVLKWSHPCGAKAGHCNGR